ncbi:hypothetical protein F2P81_017876 [Scophthalmus maximus]|uniref:Uncharacterized protein n=1 Tax=Scophthalmus maximus TaxID=52904 RepID=A0A6A4SCF6_SCOMX|nr:hypothetical protein F2P81_017876 [Scophthalmus maximus]
MCLLLVLVARTTALALMVGLVATATAERGLTCRQEIPAELLRSLWSRTVLLINTLPQEEKFSRRLRLLPKFCTKCPEVSSSKPSKWIKIIKKLERKMKKRRRDEVARKAVREFTFVLRWIDELTQHHIL